MTDVLAPITEPDDTTMAQRRHALADAADRDGLLDVAFRTMDSPFGPLLLAATVDGIVRVAFATEDHDDVLSHLAAEVSPRVLHYPVRLDDAVRELDEYFAGRRRGFDVPVDLRLAHGFRRDVLAHLPEIAFGATESYTAVATAVGSPRAVRAAGTACAMNPVPLFVPCHRVVRSDGSIGQYRGGVDVKRTLLAHEQA
jgi:methylated-DNA-[protein]-cysteine S-methyltransferase